LADTPDIPRLEEPCAWKAGAVPTGAAVPSEDRVPPDPNDARLAPEITPPPESRFERISSRAALWGFIVWGIMLALLWLVPLGWQATLHMLDVIFWPLIRVLGRFAAVAFLAGATAFLTMLAQLLLNDTPRLRTVKQCVQILSREQRALPVHSPREDALHAASVRAHWRIARASLVPVGLLLGPMIAAFLWLPARVDPAHINPAPGAAVILTAEIDGSYAGPVLLTAGGQALPPADDAPPPHTRAWPITLPAGAPAIHSYTLTAQAAWMPIEVPTGDASPPPLQIQRQPHGFSYQLPGAGVIRNLTLACPDPRGPDERAFWRPFAWAGWHWDAGWLGLYFVVYLPVMWLARRLLRVP